MANAIDWSKVSVGVVMPAIPFGTRDFPPGGKVERIGEPAFSDGGYQEFWISYPNGLHKFTIIGHKVHDVIKILGE